MSGASKQPPADGLTAFPRPSVAVDVAVLTVEAGRLGVVLWRRTGNTESGRWALPGSFLNPGERLADAVRRTLQAKCGITGLAPTQLRVMDDPLRDDRGWVLSVAHLDVVRAEALADRRADGEVQIAPVRAGGPVASGDTDGSTSGGSAGSAVRGAASSEARHGSVLELPDGQRTLPFDHETIVGLAIAELRARYAERPDPAGLLTGPFTFLRLRELHETIVGEPLQRDTFRRAMLPFVEPTDEIEQGTVGRPARLYRLRSGVDAGA